MPKESQISKMCFNKTCNQFVMGSGGLTMSLSTPFNCFL